MEAVIVAGTAALAPSGSQSSSSVSSSAHDAASHWLDALKSGFRPTSSSSSSSKGGLASYISSSSTTSGHSTFTDLLHAAFDTIWLILFPELPPWVQTFCVSLRVVAFLVIAPFLLVGVLDFAEYVVFRTLGLRRRPVQVKVAASSSSSAPSPRPRRSPTQLSPAQMHSGSYSSSSSDRQPFPSYNPAPLLTPGAYDAETLLRHRARSISSASAEAAEEWSRTGGSFARVAEVRQSSSNATSPTHLKTDFLNSTDDGGIASSSSAPQSPLFPKALLGVEGPLGGLSESEAEGDGDGDESEPDSPQLGFKSSFSAAPSPRSSLDQDRDLSPSHQRRGLKGDRLYFTPVEKGRKVSISTPSTTATTTTTTDGPLEGDEEIKAIVAAAATAADLEPSGTTVGTTASGAPIIFVGDDVIDSTDGGGGDKSNDEKS